MHPPSGQIVADKYRIIGVLGEGGVGVTFEAESIATGERVALKRVEVRGASSWKTIELFEREARILSHLAHPSIPAYRDSFVVEERDGAVFWLAQTLARGRSLAAWIESGARCDEQECKRIARALLPVLAYLHQLRPAVIHRDLKPANVIRGDDGRVFLVDFGAVREALQDGGTGGGSTVAGTYGYMAPEQYRGSARPQTDLYGLGATLLYLLARKTPAELPQKKLRVELPKDLGLSRTFAAWLSRLLEPAPEDRFVSANEALAAIDGPRTSPKRVAILGAVLAVVVGGGLGFKVWVDRALPVAQKKASAIDPFPPRLAVAQYEELVEKQRVAGHGAMIFTIAVSPDGKKVATASQDAAVKLWDATTYSLIRSHGHVGIASGAAFTADGKTLVTSGDHTLRLWDVESGSAIKTVDLGAAQATQLDVSKETIVVGSFDGNARAFDLDGKPRFTLAHSPGKGRVFAARFSPDGKTIATVSDDRTAKLWDATTGAAIHTFAGHTAAVSAVTFTPDGTTLATTSDDHTVRVYNVPARKELIALQHGDEVFSARFSPDGKFLVTGGKDLKLRLFNVPSFNLVHTVATRTMTGSLAFASSEHVLAGGHDGVFNVYRMPGSSIALPVAKKGPPPGAGSDAKEALLVFDARQKIDKGEGRALVLGEAETLCTRALEVKNDYVPALVQLSRVARRRYAYKESHAWLDKAEKLDAKSYDVHLHRAWTLENEGDVEGSRKELERAAAIDPARVDADALYARLLNHEKSWDDAIKRATRVLEGTSDPFLQYLAWEELAHSYRGSGEFEAADAAYRATTEIAPDSAWARGNYAHFLVGRGYYGRALELVREAEKRSKYGALDKTAAEAHVGAGIGVLWDHKAVPEARAHFETAIEKDAKSADAWYGVAACDRVEAVKYRDKQKMKRAKDALRRALELNPKHWYAQRALEEHERIAETL